MTTKSRWLVGIAVVAGVVSVGVGLAVAGDGGSPQVPGGMMGGSGGMMGSGSMGDGTMSAGMATMMAGEVPSDVLARCDALHDQMWSDAATDGAEVAGHSMHHENAGSTG